MMAGDGTMARVADRLKSPGRANERSDHCGAMALQSHRGYEAAPQMFVRLTGSRLSKPRQPLAPQDRLAGITG
jgi:hypothetical protein